MIDLEKVIKGLEHCSEDGCKDCPYDPDCTMCDGFTLLAKDTLELLKEQEQRINVLNRAIEQMPKQTKLLDVYGDGYAKIVRCKYCRYYHGINEGCGGMGVYPPSGDWFCADGERRDGDG